ncbi:restriction endonuclease subunit S [Frederiksenia canicola]
MKYQKLLEGLEVRELKLSELKNKLDETFRLDSEHYRKIYQRHLSMLAKFDFERLGNLLQMPVCTGHTPSMSVADYYGGDIKFIKTDNVRMDNITDLFTDYLTEKGQNELKKSALQEGDIITTIIGATFDVVGRSAMVTNENLPANINQNIALIRVNDKKINPYYLICYLNSYIGRSMLYFHSRQTEQVNLNCREVERVIIPKLALEFQNSIEALYKKSQEMQLKSKAAYVQAEQLLLNCLQLNALTPPIQAVSIKPFSASFGISGRLDAEFYQPKYEYYKTQIENYPNGFETVRTACHLKDRNFTPQETNLYHYIEISNIGRYGEIIGSILDQGGSLPSRARRKVMKNDVIISSVEGSLSNCAIVSEEYNQAICSTGFYVVSSDKINSETLLVLFKSEPLQQLLRQGCSGTILSAINKEEFLNIPLPLIEATVQKQIADLIQKSSYFRIRSREHLDQAKKAIELAIEKNQDIALDFLKGNK